MDLKSTYHTQTHLPKHTRSTYTQTYHQHTDNRITPHQHQLKYHIDNTQPTGVPVTKYYTNPITTQTTGTHTNTTKTPSFKHKAQSTHHAPPNTH